MARWASLEKNAYVQFYDDTVLRLDQRVCHDVGAASALPTSLRSCIQANRFAYPSRGQYGAALLACGQPLRPQHGPALPVAILTRIAAKKKAYEPSVTEIKDRYYQTHFVAAVTPLSLAT